MSKHTITITGVVLPETVPPQVPPPRRNIRDLILDEKQFSLYIQALRKITASSPSTDLSLSYTAESMYDTPETKPESHFQLASIHGLPYDLHWDGSVPPPGKEGYCHHASDLFPTFHRIYILAYEVRKICCFSFAIT